MIVGHIPPQPFSRRRRRKLDMYALCHSIMKSIPSSLSLYQCLVEVHARWVRGVLTPPIRVGWGRG